MGLPLPNSRGHVRDSVTKERLNWADCDPSLGDLVRPLSGRMETFGLSSMPNRAGLLINPPNASLVTSRVDQQRRERSRQPQEAMLDAVCVMVDSDDRTRGVNLCWRRAKRAGRVELGDGSIASS